MTNLEMLRVCAEVRGLRKLQVAPDGLEWSYSAFSDEAGKWIEYDPINNSDQALELLCWLVKEGCIPEIDSDGIRFDTTEVQRNIEAGDMTSPAALRRAIVWAVVKVKEGK